MNRKFAVLKTDDTERMTQVLTQYVCGQLDAGVSLEAIIKALDNVRLAALAQPSAAKRSAQWIVMQTC
jgi:negative regulator of sigma E activity